MTEPSTIQYIEQQGAILRTLLYFELFSYPLTAEEVHQFCNCPGLGLVEIALQLDELVAGGLVFRFHHFYATQNQSEWVEKRQANNRRAESCLPKAFQKARFIGAFPFVRGVFVSGSLSKNSMAPDADIDFFIVTEPGRLWLSRSLLIFFKKIFLFNSHKYFCLNYFVDTAHLCIEEKNLFTATESVTLLPMYGREWYDRFVADNEWAKGFYPNFPKRPTDIVPPHHRNFLKKTSEWLLSGWFGEQLDTLTMQITVGYWKKKFGYMDDATFGVALKSKRHVSKHHPLYFQQKVLDGHQAKWVEMTKKMENPPL